MNVLESPLSRLRANRVNKDNNISLDEEPVATKEDDFDKKDVKISSTTKAQSSTRKSYRKHRTPKYDQRTLVHRDRHNHNISQTPSPSIYAKASESKTPSVHTKANSKSKEDSNRRQRQKQSRAVSMKHVSNPETAFVHNAINYVPRRQQSFPEDLNNYNRYSKSEDLTIHDRTHRPSNSYVGIHGRRSRPIQDWTVGDVCSWVSSLGNVFRDYLTSFQDNGVDGIEYTLLLVEKQPIC